VINSTFSAIAEMVELWFMVPSADSTKTVKGLSSILQRNRTTQGEKEHGVH
jgi:hypothetical protein